MPANAKVDEADWAFDGFVIRPSARELLVDGQRVTVGARAFDLLLALVERRERVVAKTELLDLVWPGLVVEENNLQVHVWALRKLLGQRAIATLPGRGYRFTALAADTPAAPREATLASAVPARASPPLFGRGAELLALQGLLATERLVSVVGTGGVGKTALVRHLSDLLRGKVGDSVVIIDLAPLAEAGQLVPAVAGALQLTLGAGPSLAALAAQLSDCRALLVLENCEHLLQPVAELTALLLGSAPQLRLLTTSQEALKLRTEHVYRLAPLGMPQAGTLATLDEAREAGAVQLFEHRARAADARFALTPSNLAAVVEICRQLDGNALAIELAAARVPLLGVDGLRQRLGERLRLLVGGARDLPPRHRSLRAALLWSHALLTPTQQWVFRRLGVMAGGFSLEAAQQIGTADAIDAWEVLEALGAMVDKSLVLSETGLTGEPRFRLLDTMRQFALERLVEADEVADTRERHLTCFLALAEAARTPLEGPLQGEWLARLEPDRDNFFAAHSACDQAAQGVARGLRLVNALMRFWLSRGLLVQGQLMAELALARPGANQLGPLYAEGLLVVGRLNGYRGLDQEACEVLSRSVTVARACGATALAAEALARFGYARLNLADHAGARCAMEEAYTMEISLIDTRGIHRMVVSQLAELERMEGQLGAAERLYEEGLRHSRAQGDRLATMIALNNLGMVAVANGDAPRARVRLVESLAICDELHSRRGRLVVMEACAGLAGHLGQWARAARFDGAADIHTVQMGRRRDRVDAAFLEPHLERAPEPGRRGFRHGAGRGSRAALRGSGRRNAALAGDLKPRRRPGADLAPQIKND